MIKLKFNEIILIFNLFLFIGFNTCYFTIIKDKITQTQRDNEKKIILIIIVSYLISFIYEILLINPLYKDNKYYLYIYLFTTMSIYIIYYTLFLQLFHFKKDYVYKNVYRIS